MYSKKKYIQRFLYDCYRQHILPFSLQPFRRLVLIPHAHCSSNGKGLFSSNGLITWWHYMSRAGSICRELGTLYPHGSLIVMLSSFVIHIFPWAHTGPDISIYRTGADGVRSCLATKPISTSYRAFAFSFDQFFLRFLCLNLPISFLNGDCATFFT